MTTPTPTPATAASPASPASPTPGPSSPAARHGIARVVLFSLAAVALGVLIAGFWNYRLVDGFGRDVVAGRTIGDTGALAGAFGDLGATFGFVFAGVAGLAATFTACNCVVFAMLPALACPNDATGSSTSPWRALGAFVAGVIVVSVGWGLYIGWLGAEGVEALGARGARLGRARTVFTLLGSVMLLWGVLEMGFLDRVGRRLPERLRATMASPVTKAAVLGLLVGLFAVGRPFPVFREFLTYAATAGSALYGAAVMAVQGLGQILVMVGLFALLVWLFGARLVAWSRRSPAGPRTLSAFALLAGGAFFVFYWGLAFAFDLGRWGFKLGWY